MPRSAAGDRRYLEEKGGKWRVTVAVPRDLHKQLGTRLKRELRTDSLSVANANKWPHVAELKATIAAAQRALGKDSTVQEALATAKALASADREQADFIREAIQDKADAIRGAPVREVLTLFGREYEYDARREAKADQYADIASGAAVPIESHHADYLAQLTVKPRTLADDKRAVALLLAWCDAEKTPRTLQAITRKVATRFLDARLGTAATGQSAVTLKKYLNRLSRYWQWLLIREHVELNPWAGLKLPVAPVAHDEKERPFTDAEMLKLLSGPVRPEMHDLMRIGALSGARLDAIVDLRVGDCRDGLFRFKPQKRETGPRDVPIHSALADIIARRMDGKEDSADLFPEWPAPKRNTLRERSFKTSNAFTEYRRSVGVDEVVEGRRRSLVNFHSFRRWFITKAEQADQGENIIAAVVGHKRKGMTLGVYSAGPLREQARRCVEAVTLPALALHRPESEK